jgi:hypothetical protein
VKVGVELFKDFLFGLVVLLPQEDVVLLEQSETVGY